MLDEILHAIHQVTTKEKIYWIIQRAFLSRFLGNFQIGIFIDIILMDIYEL